MSRNLHTVVASCIKLTDRVLEIGCGMNKASKYKCKEYIGIDAWEKVNPDILLDVEKENLPFEDSSFDVVLMIDFIEHLEKDRGLEVIEEAKRVASRSVVMFTPLIWSSNEQHTNDPKLWCYGNKYNNHKSLWALEDFDGWTRFDKNVRSNLLNYFLGIYEVNK